MNNKKFQFAGLTFDAFVRQFSRVACPSMLLLSLLKLVINNYSLHCPGLNNSSN